MGIIVILIAISLSIALLFLVIFYWNMKSGQYDDTYTPSIRMLFEYKMTKDKGSVDDPVANTGSSAPPSGTDTEYQTQR